MTTSRVTHWQLRTRSLRLEERPLLMGIVNVTPDSFSDGGSFLDPHRAVEQALTLIEEGADIIDIGGESTRPYAVEVPSDEEARRVLPVLQALSRQTDVPLSIDTRKPSVAAAALDEGAEIINDVSGFRADDMQRIAVAGKAGICLMHMRGTPQTMQDEPEYGDVVSEVCGYLQRQARRLTDAGVAPERICLDPGIGFGKRTEHNWQLLRGIEQLLALQHPLLIGHSRKGFLGKLIGDDQADRRYATIGVGLAMAAAGVHILRVHEVRPLREALLAFTACSPISTP